MRRADRGPVALLMATSALLGAAFYFASPARADGTLTSDEQNFGDVYGEIAICPVLSKYHSLSGVMGVTQAVADEGYTLDNAVDIVNYTVKQYCPQNWGLLVAVGKAARAANGGQQI